MPNFDERILQAPDFLTPEVWIPFFRDTTSPVTVLVGQDPDVRDGGIGHMRSIPIPDFVWDLLAPGDFDVLASTDLGGMRDMSEEGEIMACVGP